MASVRETEWITPREWARRVNLLRRADRFRVLVEVAPGLVSKKKLSPEEHDITFKAVGPDPPEGTKLHDLVACANGLSVGRVTVGLRDYKDGGGALSEVAVAYGTHSLPPSM